MSQCLSIGETTSVNYNTNKVFFSNTVQAKLVFRSDSVQYVSAYMNIH